MKKHLLWVLTVLISSTMYAQIKFEKGYYINTSGEKIEGYIKNIDWHFTPEEFIFKSTLNGESNTLNVSDIKEVAVYNGAKFIKYFVRVDISTDNLQKLSNSKEPVWESRELLLRVLVSDKATLYKYTTQEVRAYFFAMNDSVPIELVYKKYMVDGSTMGENSQFRQQIYKSLKCNSISLEEVKKLRFRESELIEIFEKYNSCISGKPIESSKNKKKNTIINLSVRPGVNLSSVDLTNSSTPSYGADFDSEMGARLGVEFEYVLPFNKNKWAFITEPTYQYYNTEKKIIYNETITIKNEATMVVDYSSIEFPVGFRYYIFLNKNTKLFIDGTAVFDLALNNHIYAKERTQLINLDEPTGLDIGLGAGIKFANKYSAQLRYLTPRSVSGESITFDGRYSTVSFIVGYTFFSTKKGKK